MVVERAAYPHPWSKGIMSDCLNSGYCCWLCQFDGEVIGHSVMSVAVGESHILNLAIHPDYQGRGLGRRLLGHMLDIARRHHATSAFLEVRASNHTAAGLYDSIGFNEIGRRDGYYPAENGREDAIIYGLEL